MNALLSVATGIFSDSLQKNMSTLEKWWPDSIHAWTDLLPPGSPTHAEQPYAFKAFAMKWAFDAGYQTATWIDSIVHMEGSPSRYLAELHTVGYYFQNNGFNCAQTCSDKMLFHYRVERDQAARMVEVVGGFWGLHARYRDFVDELVENSKLGLFSGAREHSTQDSSDSRFLFCRHDQSLMSLMVNMRRWKISDGPGSFFNYRTNKDCVRPVECFVAGHARRGNPSASGTRTRSPLGPIRVLNGGFIPPILH